MSTPPNTVRLAVIDADSGFVRVLSRRFETAGWQYRILPSGLPAEELLAMRLNAVVVDLGALGSGAWEFLEKVCGMLPELGVVVCTGESTVAERVRGLRLGADDWIDKPAHPEEVMARVEAVVRRRRRSAPTPEEGPLVAGEVELRPDRFEAYVGGQGIGLTRREFELLRVLAEANGRVIEREELYQRVWGYAMAHGDRSVDVFVGRLRSKLARHSPGWEYIHTHFGIGYRFEAEPATESQLPEPGPPGGTAGSSERAADPSGRAAGSERPGDR